MATERLAGPALKAWLLERTEPIPFSGCWIWTGSTRRGGYGKCKFRGRWVMAHRLMFEAVHGKIPEGMKVCHRCDVPPCCNPDHLFLGTQSDNIRDAVSKGRWKQVPPRPDNRGERQGASKLTEATVRDIRADAGATTQRELAELYGVHQVTISQILLRKTWRHL